MSEERSGPFELTPTFIQILFILGIFGVALQAYYSIIALKAEIQLPFLLLTVHTILNLLLGVVAIYALVQIIRMKKRGVKIFLAIVIIEYIYIFIISLNGYFGFVKIALVFAFAFGALDELKVLAIINLSQLMPLLSGIGLIFFWYYYEKMD